MDGERRLTVDVEERQERQHAITLPIRIPIPAELPSFSRLDHQDITHDVPMREHDPLRMPRRAGRVHQKRQILRRVNLPLPEPCRTRRIPNRRKMLDLALPIPLISHHYNPFLRQPHHMRRLPCAFDKRHLSNDGLGARVAQLERQLRGRVARVRRRDDAAGPVRAPCHGGGVDAVGRVEGEHVAFAPVPEGAEAGAEGESGGFYLGVGVGAGGVGVEVDYWGVVSADVGAKRAR